MYFQVISTIGIPVLNGHCNVKYNKLLIKFLLMHDALKSTIALEVWIEKKKFSRNQTGNLNTKGKDSDLIIP